MSQKVLVTAGAAGIGLAIARGFASAGAAVCICDVDEATLDRACRDMPPIHGLPCDVGDRRAVEEMMHRATAWLGGLDVLINNAGIAGPTCPVEDLDPDAWDAVLRVNLTGAFLVTRAAIPHLIRSGEGVIINISSVAGRLGYPRRSAYCASKWGLIGFTKTLSMELGRHGIRANAILPGAVEGERLARVHRSRAEALGLTLEEVRRAGLDSQSLRHWVGAEEIAALALFLASDAARSISGQAIPIDGDRQHL